MSDTKIEWATRVWNPITGCSPVSEGCRNCYAARFAQRLAGRYGYPAVNPFQVTFHEDKLMEPLRWKKPQRVFVCSMGDMFHAAARREWIDDVLEVMAATPQHRYLMLTKRPENMREKLYGITPYYACRELGGGDYLRNLWLGVSVENQETTWRVKSLLEIPAAGYFVSVEPMLGRVNVSKYLSCRGCGTRKRAALPTGAVDCCPEATGMLDWVICGAEQGAGKRPCDHWAIERLCSDCIYAGVPFFGKRDSAGNAIFPREIPADLQLPGE